PNRLKRHIDIFTIPQRSTPEKTIVPLQKTSSQDKISTTISLHGCNTMVLKPRIPDAPPGLTTP
ncbi:hypothetical protein, partial [uncultured Fretibacterium sp.]|uniref:hypothetical protein n=1 Tax=uncultured Fretibacterium sp. TaxID=1678694 RepID=UPI0026111EDC